MKTASRIGDANWKEFARCIRNVDLFQKYLKRRHATFHSLKKVTKHGKPFWCPELTIANHANLGKLLEAEKTTCQWKRVWLNERLLNAIGAPTRQRLLGMLEKAPLGKKFPKRASSERIEKRRAAAVKKRYCTRIPSVVFRRKTSENGQLRWIHGNKSLMLSRIAQWYLWACVRHFLWSFTLHELKEPLKQSSNTNFFSNLTDSMSNLRPNTKTFLLEIYNACYDHAVWPWFLSRRVFIRKPNKDRYDYCSSFRPSTLASLFGKLSERLLCNRLNQFLETNNVLADE